MAEYDGEIRINTKIDTSGIVRSMSEVRLAIERGISGSKPMRNTEQEVKQLGDSYSNTAQKVSELKTTMEAQKNTQFPKETTSQLMTLENRIVKTTDIVASLYAKMDSLRETKIPTQEYKEIESDISKAERELNKLIEKQAQLEHEGKNSGSAWENINQKILATKDYIALAKNELQDLVNSGKAFTLGTETEEYKKIEADAKNYKNTLDALIQKQRELNGELQEAADIARLRKASENIDRSFERDREEERRRLETPPELLQPQFSMMDPGTFQEGQKEIQSLVDALNRQELGSEKESKKREVEKAKLRELINEEIRLAEIKRDSTVVDEELIELLERRKEVLQRIADLEKADRGEGYQEYYDAQGELSNINQRIGSIRQERSETDEIRSSYVHLSDAVKNAFKTMAQTLTDIPVEGLKVGLRGVIVLFKSLESVSVSVLKRTGTAIQEFAISPLKLLEISAKKAFSSIGKNSKASNNMFNKGFKSILKYGLGIRSTYMLINKLRKAIKDGFSNLYYDKNIPVFKSQVDSLRASILTIKNAFAAAFRPIVEVAIPYIQRLIEYISSLLNVVGQFMAAITGQEKYTSAIKQTTAAIEKQNKAQNKQLSNLDNLNNLTSDKGSNGKDTTGMFEELPIEEKWNDITDRLKKMWENSDFFDLGKNIGERLKNALDSIPWNEIKEKARKVGKSFATLINGFSEVDGLGYSIGRTLAEAINTGFAFLNEFVHQIHTDSIGKFLAEIINGITQPIEWNVIYDTFTTAAHKIAELINNFFSPDDLDYESISNAISNFVNTIVDSLYILITETEWGEIGESLGKTLSDAWITIDWSKAGETIGEYFKAFFDFVGKAIEAVDWWAVGESVEAFLCGIDWAGVADSFFEAIGAVFGGFSAFFGGLLTDGIHSALNFFGDKIEEAGGNVVEGILVGIAEALVGIGEWIKIHVFNPFFNGFKKAFQIHSPSKVMIEMGGYIVSGLLEGLKEKWKNVVNWITDKINWLKDKLSGIAGKVTSAFTGGGNSNAKTNKRSALFSTPAVSTPYAANPAFAALSTTPIPKLATGAVIPANKEFLAVLGDQKHGTNIEAPLEMIKQANKEGLLEILNQLGLPSGGGGQEINLNLTVECDGHQLLHLMQKLNREYFKQTGRNAFIY